MKGDFTKLLSNSELAKKKYTGVYMQQGRLQLDSDWNEQVAIQKHLVQTYTQDLIGGSEGEGSGAPGANYDGKNFAIKLLPGELDFEILKGHIYVNGILCELDQNKRYSEQFSPDNFQDGLGEGDFEPNTRYIAYLEVWERHITELEESDIAEAALNGLDTATRTKIVWQVKLIKESEWQSFLDTNKDRKVLLSTTPTEKIPQDNRLYRVEIHEGGPRDEAKFKWSRDNGSVTFAVTQIQDNVLTVKSRGRDISQILAPGDWIEVIDECREKNHQPGTLAKLSSVVATSSEGGKLLIEDTVIGDAVTPDNYEVKPGPTTQVKIRRWDFDPTKPDNPLYSIDQELVLDSVIKVKFDDVSCKYKTGDYWLFSVRVNQPVVAQPQLKSNGIHYYYLKLASAIYNDQSFQTEDDNIPDSFWRDERILFPPLIKCINKDDGQGLQGIDRLSIGTSLAFSTLEVQNTDDEISDGVKIQSYPGDSTNSILQLSDGSSNGSGSPATNLPIGTTITVKEQSTTIVEKSPNGILHTYRVDPPLENRIEEPTDYTYQVPIARFTNSNGEPQVTITPLGKIKASSLELDPTSSFQTGTFIGNQFQIQHADSGQNYGSLQAVNSQLRFTAENNANFAFLNGDVSIQKAGEDERANLTVDGQISANSLVLPGDSTLEAATIRAGFFFGDGSNLTGITAEQVGALVSVEGVSHPGGNINLVNRNAITIATNPDTHRIFIGENHSGNSDNPHGVTATQVGALVSLEGVSNPGGNIDLVNQDAITVTTNQDTHRIFIGENHSGRDDNPHEVTAAQIGALASLDGISSPGGNINLVNEDAIIVTSNQTDRQITIGETHSGRTDNPHAVTATQVGALTSLDGVSSPGGDIDLVNRNAITITSNEAARRIFIGENHSGSTDNPHAVTANQVGALVSLGGVSNPGGNIDLINRNAITIATNPDTHRIIIGETHSSQTDNPHDVTAAQVGAIPTTGGTVTGDLTVEHNLLVQNNFLTQNSLTVSNNLVVGAPPATFAPGSNLYVNGQVVVGSSRRIKDNITTLSSQEVTELLTELTPVKYSYKVDEENTLHAGFISEDVPDIVASSDKRSINPVDIVAILTKAVQDQRQTSMALADFVDRQQQEIDRQRREISQLQEKINRLEENSSNRPWFR